MSDVGGPQVGTAEAHVRHQRALGHHVLVEQLALGRQHADCFVTRVATQMLPSPSTAIESSSW